MSRLRFHNAGIAVLTVLCVWSQGATTEAVFTANNGRQRTAQFVSMKSDTVTIELPSANGTSEQRRYHKGLFKSIRLADGTEVDLSVPDYSPPVKITEWDDLAQTVPADTAPRSPQAIRKTNRERETSALLPQNMLPDLNAVFARLLPERDTTATVAVLPFTTHGALDPDVGVSASECAVVFLTTRTGYRVVERAQYGKVMQEIALSQSGALSDSFALEAGRQLAAQYLVVGTVSEESGQRLVAARLVNTQSGEVVSAAASQMGQRTLDDIYRAALGERLRPSSTIFRSAVLPGWGQFYSGHPAHGVVTLLASAAAAGTLVWSALDYRDMNEQVTKFKDHDASTVIEGETTEQWAARANEAVSDVNQAATRTNIIAGATALVWVLNLVDAAVCGVADARTTKNRYFSLAPAVTPKGAAIVLTFDLSTPSR